MNREKKSIMTYHNIVNYSCLSKIAIGELISNNGNRFRESFVYVKFYHFYSVFRQVFSHEKLLRGVKNEHLSIIKMKFSIYRVNV